MQYIFTKSLRNRNLRQLADTINGTVTLSVIKFFLEGKSIGGHAEEHAREETGKIGPDNIVITDQATVGNPSYNGINKRKTMIAVLSIKILNSVMLCIEHEALTTTVAV